MSKKTIHIIGGGVIGLCAAWYLQEEGYEVTVIDQSDLSNGTSHGNAGMIVPSHFIPLAAPGVISKGIRWMFSAKSPFYIRPRLNNKLIQWLWQFYLSCNENKVHNAAPVLLAFNQWSKFLYETFAEEVGLDFSFEKKGLLMLFKTSKQQKEEASMVKQSKQLGLSANLLSKAEVEQLEQNANLNILGGAYFPDDAHLHPQQFIQQLLLRLKQTGVQFLQAKVVNFDIKDQQIKAIIDSNQQSIPTQQVLCTAGTWSAQLLEKAGISMLLQDGRGYSFTLPLSSNSPRIPSILAEAKVAITPMHQQLRIGGTLELGSLLSKKDKINALRLKGILERTTQYYPQLDVQPLYEQTPWVGYRPCTPDGMPYMGKAPKVQNLFIATGHGMMGMSLGPATGKLMRQIISKQKTSITTELFKIDRF